MLINALSYINNEIDDGYKEYIEMKWRISRKA